MRGGKPHELLCSNEIGKKAADTFRLRAAHCGSKFNQRIQYEKTQKMSTVNNYNEITWTKVAPPLLQGGYHIVEKSVVEWACTCW